MSIFKAKRYAYGVHVPDNKDLCKNCPIENAPSPEKVFISLSQHIGAPATCVVNQGDYVKKGQLIGKESGFVSANVYSSVSGVAESVCDIVNGLGQKQTHVVIANDYKDDEVLLNPMADTEKQSIIDRIRLAGIVGLGGAGFPTAVKLSPKNQLDTLIINGAECEPYLNCDNRLMIERHNDVYKGIMYTAKALGVDNIIVGIEANKPEAIEIFSKYENIKVAILKKQYPMGSEKHLIYCATGRKVPVGKMPFDVSVCVQNIKTMIAVFEAVELNKPLTEIVMTVSGRAITNPKNLKVRIGTPFTNLIDYCGGNSKNVKKAIAGGPMMGRALANLNHYVKKTDSGLLLLSEKEADTSEPTNCINCAVCAKNCPMRLMPMYIESYALAGDYLNAEKYGAMNCIECGSCAFNCPAKRPLVQSINMAKSKIKEMKSNG